MKNHKKFDCLFYLMSVLFLDLILITVINEKNWLFLLILNSSTQYMINHL